MNQYGENGSTLHQIARDSIKNIELNIFSDRHIKKRIDDYELFIDNWDRIEANQLKIVVAYIESSADLFNRYKSAKGKPEGIYFWMSVWSWVLMLFSFGIPFSLLQDAEAQGVLGDSSLILYLLLSPCASAITKLLGVPADAKDVISQFLVNRPEGLQLLDVLSMIGCITFSLGVVLSAVSSKGKRKKIASVRKALETQLMMTRRLYTFLSLHKRQRLRQLVFRYPNPRYTEHCYLGKYIEVSWDKLQVTRWLEEGFGASDFLQTPAS